VCIIQFWNLCLHCVCHDSWLLTRDSWLMTHKSYIMRLYMVCMVRAPRHQVRMVRASFKVYTCASHRHDSWLHDFDDSWLRSVWQGYARWFSKFLVWQHGTMSGMACTCRCLFTPCFITIRCACERERVRVCVEGVGKVRESEKAWTSGWNQRKCVLVMSATACTFRSGGLHRIVV